MELKSDAFEIERRDQNEWVLKQRHYRNEVGVLSVNNLGGVFFEATNNFTYDRVSVEELHRLMDKLNEEYPNGK